ncbi:tetratricopeptide repeat (TPR)-like superfamily protein [Artemisia annua]|uniref:Tetratricopeptide repeat (TPR)-like superfamily protein n=1 Tax=Artemisia annua TaxID=35608 RepID=A0A2U1PFS2_ARTAN|nr:tetratricopeptide repeat (TPR)-like superfamily protein [Artemisia annua]
MARLALEKLLVLESLAIQASTNYSPFGFKSLQFTSNALTNQEHKYDWKSALGVFKWEESHPNYTPLSESYDTMLEILGKVKQVEKMKTLLKQMNHHHLVTVNSKAMVMRRLCGA